MKHLKSTFRDLYNLFEINITIRNITEPFASFDAESQSGTILSFMDKKNFDVVGVRENAEVVGYANRNDLSNGSRLGDHTIAFHSDEIIGENDPLIRAFQMLRSRKRVFVTILRGIGGIVTIGDLQKAPVRMWLFGIISLIEMNFLQIIRVYFPQESWRLVLNQSRVTLAEQLLLQRQRMNAEIDLADCLQFCDKRDIVLSKDHLLKSLGFTSKSEGEKKLKDVQNLRDELAHSQDIITSKWPRTADVAADAERILQACETLVQM
ncbi:hypothetical protein L0222_15585 [bacterium]|nr:hypothetical protein [bacterium]